MLSSKERQNRIYLSRPPINPNPKPNPNSNPSPYSTWLSSSRPPIIPGGPPLVSKPLSMPPPAFTPTAALVASPSSSHGEPPRHVRIRMVALLSISPPRSWMIHVTRKHHKVEPSPHRPSDNLPLLGPNPESRSRSYHNTWLQAAVWLVGSSWMERALSIQLIIKVSILSTRMAFPSSQPNPSPLLRFYPPPLRGSKRPNRGRQTPPAEGC